MERVLNMRCSVCLTTLTVRTRVTREYRDTMGRVYKRIRQPKYHPCPNLNDPYYHPARAPKEEV